ncbi:MAG: hypothetical protein Q7J20_08040 [Candidatus Nitrotoga sp.]|nr:hypothetical protein [Candidatus Nitrotoga sp.]MDP3608007.1 hypothetical protein [Methylophilus sp.]RFC41298.1 MAG: hypothetical protein DID89_2727546016 [Candidatus Nitrotoga sp. CP45]
MNVEIKDSENIYVYKLVADNGGAPCIHKGVLSLSICKPRIRQAADVDDWIIGFGGKSVADLKERLIYIAQVTKVVDHGDYYDSETYRGRPDCIYRKVGNAYEYVPNSLFHDSEDLPHDLGAAPSFDRARNLLSDRFVYFGREGDRSIIESVFDLYDGLPRDFVKNHPDQTRERFEQFIQSIVSKYGFKVCGKPTHAEITTKCHESEDEYQVYSRCNSK